MVNNTTNINKTKESLNSDGQQYHQYQQNKRKIKFSFLHNGNTHYSLCMNTRKLHNWNCFFSYICIHYAKYVIHVFALLSLSLLVTWLLHMLCWNKDHKTNYQFYSQLFQALTPVSIDVKGSPLVKSDSKPPPKNTQKSNSDICITFARNYFTTSFETTFLVQLMFGKPRYNPNSKEYKLTAIGFDIVGHSLFKPVVI